MSELSEIFDRDPLSLTKSPLNPEERAQLITKYREDRVRYLSGVKAPKLEKAKIDLDSLDI